jgi:hypothetical protein
MQSQLRFGLLNTHMDQFKICDICDLNKSASV